MAADRSCWNVGGPLTSSWAGSYWSGCPPIAASILPQPHLCIGPGHTAGRQQRDQPQNWRRSCFPIAESTRGNKEPVTDSWRLLMFDQSLDGGPHGGSIRGAHLRPDPDAHEEPDLGAYASLEPSPGPTSVQHRGSNPALWSMTCVKKMRN